MKTYDPKQVILTVGGRQITGWADGTFIEVERDADAYELTVGADGDAARSKSNNRAGKITVTLLQTSEGNAVLSGFAAADELSNGGVVAIMARDKSGASFFVADQAWVQKYPKSGYSKNIETREWVLRSDSINIYEGGN